MRVVVLAGGTSTEREVSIISGKEIYNALKRKGHKVILLDVSTGVSFDKDLTVNCDFKTLFDRDINWEYVIDQTCYNGDNNYNAVGYFGSNVLSICQEADIVFIALHGENGENGKIQACFDLLGIKYTGTDYISSALSMDKGITKDIFLSNGIMSPEGFRLKKEYLERIDVIQKMIFDNNVGFPCVVKTSCGGSSIGVTIVQKSSDLIEAVSETFKYGDEIIIERFIPGREFSIGVIEGDALPIVEIEPKEGFYDYTNKYKAGATVETCPANLDTCSSEKMKEIAQKAFAALRLKKYARFDFRMEANTGTIYCLEGNTLPGMTPTSLIPQEAQAVGITFDDLCEKIMSL
ncbi:D-alanine--D-alanine ligase family protein [Butyrivibrio fibrisolvens]|uniref:D-alanine--D-alanine ligase family protein n=1 Tax=Butyrivibrio fibrisolvens TaxID=831 RepID=UPI00200A9E13|nr:D-alanine--D-alanine ligase [Butyrivibrio fibrisolvens]